MASACELRLQDVSVSRRHAVFEVTVERCVLRDLGSVNGSFLTTQVNGLGVCAAETQRRRAPVCSPAID
ncbi:MAG: FHA domain-containing protein, partial [Acidobacteria bacterium]|nr:FHA domain-containing protein [Acidobacteriota bacterium]